MAPPRMACSALAQVYETRAKIRKTIDDIRSALRGVQKKKNALLYGGLSILDVASAELFSSVQAVASSVTSALMRSYSSVVAAAVDAFLAPLLFILASGPEAVFSLVNLPQKEAIDAGNRERIFLNKARHNIDVVISIISRWTIEISGGKYVAKMSEALPHIKAAIDKCSNLIGKLDAGNETIDMRYASQEYKSAYFDQRMFNSIKGHVRTAIEITKSDPIILNQEIIEERRREYAEAEYQKEYPAIIARYKALKRQVHVKYVTSNQSPKDIAEYTAASHFLKTSQDIALKNARAKADRKAALNKDLYIDIIRSVRDQWTIESRTLLSNLAQFAKNIGLAYINYRDCQAMTHSIYSIRTLIGSLITQMIKIIAAVGNSTAKGAAWSMQLTQSLLEGVYELFQSAIDRFSDPDQKEPISATGLSVKLSVGHGMLVSADSLMAASITKKLIESINADEIYTAENERLTEFIIKLASIRDWDGKPDIWAPSPLNSVIPPYVKLIGSAAAALSTIATVGLVSNANAISAVRKRVIEMERDFRSLRTHNSQVLGALNSYTPTPNPYVEQVRDILSKYTSVVAWLTVGYSIGSALTALGMDIDEDLGGEFTEKVNEKNCRIAYKDLFPEELNAGKIMTKTASAPLATNDSFTSKLEENDMKTEVCRAGIEGIHIEFEGPELFNTSPQTPPLKAR